MMILKILWCKESACNAGDLGSNPGSGRSSGEGNGNPLQYSCLENPMHTGTWQATVHGVTRVRHDLATKPATMLKILKEKMLFAANIIMPLRFSKGSAFLSHLIIIGNICFLNLGRMN